jgi:hypothetical protein
MGWPHAGGFQLPFDLIGDGLHLGRGVAGAKQKIIGKRSDLRDIEDHQVVCLLVIGGIHRNFQGFIHRSP